MYFTENKSYFYLFNETCLFAKIKLVKSGFYSYYIDILTLTIYFILAAAVVTCDFETDLLGNCFMDSDRTTDIEWSMLSV